MNNLKTLKLRYKKGIISKPDFIIQMNDIHKVLFDYSEFIKGTDIAKIEISNDYVIMTSRISSVKIICNKGDRRIAPFEILNFDYFEKNDFPMLINLVSDNMLFFDIGANIGWVSLNIAKLKKGVRIYAFEPIPQTFEALKKNIKINQVSNIKTYKFGFSDENKKATLYFNPKDSTTASAANLSQNEKVEKVQCRLIKMDDFTNKNHLKVDFIKCDIEGAEIFALKGGIETINKYKPIIFSEMLRKWSKKFNYSPNEIIKLLKDIGYKCFVVRNKRLVEFYKMDEKTLETNFFFLHREKHKKKIKKFS